MFLPNNIHILGTYHYLKLYIEFINFQLCILYFTNTASFPVADRDTVQTRYALTLSIIS